MKGYDTVSCTLLCTAVDRPTGLTAKPLPQEPGSFSVSWTPPASLTNLTGYRVYYSGADDSGSIDVGAPTTEVTIDNRTAGVTYTITMVALSPHLPSPVVGPVTVTLGEDNQYSTDIVVYCYMCWTNITTHLVSIYIILLLLSLRSAGGQIYGTPPPQKKKKDGEFESRK